MNKKNKEHIEAVCDEMLVKMAETLLEKVKDPESRASTFDVARKFLKDQEAFLKPNSTPVHHLREAITEEMPFKDERLSG